MTERLSDGGDSGLFTCRTQKKSPLLAGSQNKTAYEKTTSFYKMDLLGLRLLRRFGGLSLGGCLGSGCGLGGISGLLASA